MEELRDFTERRGHERAPVQNLIVGILNASGPVTIGSINDISLGGVKFTYNDLSMKPDDHFIHSIDLIAEDFSLVNIPCDSAWDADIEKESFSKFTNLKQCGIRFGQLTPVQTFLLKNLIERCSSQEMKGFISKSGKSASQ